MLRLEWSGGTILLKGGEPPRAVRRYFKYDQRTGCYRALAINYRLIVERLEAFGVKFIDDVIHAPELQVRPLQKIILRRYQEEALDRWLKLRRGVIVLPTGAGKTLVAVSAMARLSVATLVVVPTIELMDQWISAIQKYLDVKPGRLGGGSKEIRPVTVSTYDSAYINAERLGDRFLLLIVDEAHHLPSPGYRQIAELIAAPWRMGLTATPEREDGLHRDLGFLLGPVIYRRTVAELAGEWLAPFKIIRLRASMSKDEGKEYRRLTRKYRAFLKSRGISIRSPRDFERLIALSVKDPEAREALLAWHKARRIALHASMKIDILEELLRRHRSDKVLIFAEHGDVVRKISSRFLVPEITYKISEDERRLVLEKFKKGEIRVLVTSKVLEEGIDVPEANVAIILSGTSSRREFIQRLGRILRAREGKKAILYEVVTRGTREVAASRKRRRGIGSFNTRRG